MHALEDALIDYGVALICIGAVMGVFFEPNTIPTVLMVIGLVSFIVGIMVAEP